MKAPGNTITLGTRSFTVEGFTFDQLKLLVPKFADAGKPWDEGGIDAQREIIRQALSDQIAADELDQLKVTLDQIDHAIGVISRVSGLEEMGKRMARVTTDQSTTGTTSTA